MRLIDLWIALAAPVLEPYQTLCSREVLSRYLNLLVQTNSDRQGTKVPVGLRAVCGLGRAKEGPTGKEVPSSDTGEEHP